MNPFDQLMTDLVTLIKQDGTKIENIKASVQKGKIFIHSSDFLIEPRDYIQRQMSNGGEETYEVIDPGFHEQFHAIPAGYQMDVRKLGIPEAKRAIQSITYNISGNNARVNQNSIDNSSNTVVLNNDIKEYLEALRAEIDRLNIKETEKQSAHEITDAMEANLSTENPSKAVLSVLVKALPHAASIASITSAIISCM